MAEATAEGLTGMLRTEPTPNHTAPPAPASAPRYRFRLAGEDDDPQIRRLQRETSMKGPVSVSLRCEPSYFQTIGPKGLHQTLVAFEERGGRIVGMASRSVQPLYVDGEPTNVGYLSGLRILEPHRGGTLLARGYHEMRRLHADRAADYYLTTIVDGNEPALASLPHGRASLPSYFALGEYYTFVLPIGSRRVNDRSDVQVRPLSEDDIPAAVGFLQQQGKSKLFFPCYEEDLFSSSSAVLCGLHSADILSAWRGDELMGLLGTWDQSSLKQWVVNGYSPILRLLRPAFNGVAQCLGWPTFPGPGQQLPTTMAAFPLVKNDDAETFSQLLNKACRHVRLRHPRSRSLLVGAFQHDPLSELLRRASLHRFVSHVYLVYWDEGLARPNRFLGRNLYLEVGCL